MKSTLLQMLAKTKAYFENPASKAFILTKVFSFPFWGVFDLLPLILCKELHATPFEITTIIALKPLTALFSTYWSSLVHGKQHRLVSNLFWAHILKFLPFILAPIFTNPWIFIFAFGTHMFLLRGMIPAWMEILKLNLSQEKRGKVCAAGSTINYLGTALLPFLFGYLLDHLENSWRWIFPITGTLGILSSWFIYQIPNLIDIPQTKVQDKERLTDHVAKPWKSTWKILSHRPDFLRFQIGFFLGGAGLMMIHPVLPKYFVDHLHLSYTNVLLATSLCKGAGFAISSPLWVRLFNRSEIFSFCSRVPMIAAVFPILLILAQLNLTFLFLAYLLYGVMQGGSELGWKMSGPVFSKHTDSSPYSSINVLAVGIRGGIFPYCGAAIFLLGGPYLAMILGGLLCIGGSLSLKKSSKKYALPLSTST